MEEQNIQKTGFPTGKKELLFGAAILPAALALLNCVLWGGFQLGFSIAAILCIAAATGYLLTSGCRLNGYTAALLGLSVVICAGFARGNDAFVKFVMVQFLLLAVNLGLCLLSGQNLRASGGFTSWLDAPRGLFSFGMGGITPAMKGISNAFRRSGELGRKSGAVLIGLLIALPVLVVMIPLLICADAAFEGLMARLPRLDIAQILNTLLWGGCLAVVLYTRATALRHTPKQPQPEAKPRRGIHPVTANTVLAAVCLMYFVYLLSQLAYLIGGFAGILPEGYTLAQYARRGFFEMAWLCAINLGIIGVSVSLAKKNGTTPLSTRLLCLFIGFITVFFVAASSGKMFLYISGYGLTRLRLLTQIIMLWLGLITLFVMIHLFVPKFAYMRHGVIWALVIGAVLLWADVDTVVARHNVNAYLSGKLETVDVDHLEILSDGAVPYLEELARNADPETAQEAKEALTRQAGWRAGQYSDFRGWNWATAAAEAVWENYRQDPDVKEIF